eukprot:scaffold101690_cov21-Tisochrysis_lutea.AAC.4
MDVKRCQPCYRLKPFYVRSSNDFLSCSERDVMDGPATACGLLEVLIADVAHVDVIKVGSTLCAASSQKEGNGKHET